MDGAYENQVWYTIATSFAHAPTIHTHGYLNMFSALRYLLSKQHTNVKHTAGLHSLSCRLQHSHSQHLPPIAREDQVID